MITGVKENDKVTLSFEEYRTFVLIYAGHVDYEYSSDEINFIMSFTDVVTYDRMYDLFINNSDYSSLKLILKYKDLYFDSFHKRVKLKNKILNLFLVDGEYSRPEKVFLDFLNRMMTYNHVL